MARPAYLPPEKVAVISILPYRSRVEAGRKTFVAEPAPLDKTKSVDFKDRFRYFQAEGEKGDILIRAHHEWIDSKLSEESSRSDWVGMPIPAEAIAEDIVNKTSTSAWSAEHDARPGVMALPVGQTEPTEEDLAHLTALQEKYARKIVLAGRKLQQQGKYDEIGDEHHIWAKWLGLGDDPFSKQSLSSAPAPSNDLGAVLGVFTQLQEQIKKQQEQIEALTKANVVSASAGPVAPPLKGASK